jgi:predicted amidohydrolase
MAAGFKQLGNIDWNHYVESLAKLSKNTGLACVAGSLAMPSDDPDGRRWAASLYFDPQGEIACRYDKIHLFDVDVGDEKGSYRESNYYLHGKSPAVFDLGRARVGMSICFDLRFPALYQHYKSEAANIILVPSAFTYTTGKKHWELLLRARAIETQCYIVAPNQVGEHDDGRKTWGHSMIVSPDGDLLLDMAFEQGVKCCDLDLSLPEKLREAMPLTPSECL